MPESSPAPNQNPSGATPANPAAQAELAAAVAATNAFEAAAAPAAPDPRSAATGPAPLSMTPTPAVFPDLSRPGSGANLGAIDLLRDVSLQVRVELGRTRMLVEDVLRLGADSVVELDKSAGDPIDIYVNGRHIARGEVLVLNENFCVRVSEIIEQYQVEEMPEAGAGPTATLQVLIPPKTDVA